MNPDLRITSVLLHGGVIAFFVFLAVYGLISWGP